MDLIRVSSLPSVSDEGRKDGLYVHTCAHAHMSDSKSSQVESEDMMCVGGGVMERNWLEIELKPWAIASLE